MTINPETLDTKGLIKLLSWLSPSFPVGAYSYSHGIEYAVEVGTVIDCKSAESWVRSILEFGAGSVDAGLFLEAHRAVINNQVERLQNVVELARVMRATSEMSLETTAQGTAFVLALRAAWSNPTMDYWLHSLGKGPAYPVVVAVAAACEGIDELYSLTAYLHAMAANLVSSAVRLVPLGQSDGQRVMASMSRVIPILATQACQKPFEDIGSSALMVDWTSMMHETQYTRLYRS